MPIPNPKISVIMPVYNGGEFLREAIDSIIAQTFSDFEFLILDDGSSDGSIDIIRSYDDSRIRLETSGSNLGLPRILNKGLELARGEFIARMDCDDISLPTRFAEQLSFLLQNRDIDMLGTQGIHIDADGHPCRTEIAQLHPTEPGVIRWTIVFQCCFNHPTVMMRKSFLSKYGGYNPDFVLAEDYELWLRSVFTTKFSNLSNPLVKIRKHDKNVSKTSGETQLIGSYLAISNTLSRIFGRKVSVETVRRLHYPSLMASNEEVIEVTDAIMQILAKCTDPFNLSPRERKNIRSSAVDRLVTIATEALKHRHSRFIRPLKTAVSINAVHTIRTATRKLIEFALRRTCTNK